MGRVLALLALLAACSTERPTALAPAGSRGVPAEAPDALMGARDRAALAQVAAAREGVSLDSDYRIGPQDLLDIRIPKLVGTRESTFPRAGAVATPLTEAPVFEQGYRVAADGTIALPLLGTVRVACSSPPELEQRLTRLLIDEQILRAPQVSVLVAEYRSHVAAVVGSVERPGSYPISRSGMRLADLIWAAGGPSRDAGRVLEFRPAPVKSEVADQACVQAVPAADAARIEPKDGGHRLVVALDATPAKTESFSLHDPPRLVIDLTGVNASSTALPLSDPRVRQVRIAAHDGRLRVVLELVAPLEPPPVVRTDGKPLVVEIGAAGRAPTAPAEPADANLIRLDLAVLLHHVDDMAINPKVLPGDVVSVSPAGSVLVDGWVDKPGSYQVTRGLTVSGAVAAAGGQLFAADRSHTTVKRSLGPGETRSFEVDLDAVAAGQAPDITISAGDVCRLPLYPVPTIPWSCWH